MSDFSQIRSGLVIFPTRDVLRARDLQVQSGHPIVYATNSGPPDLPIAVLVVQPTFPSLLVLLAPTKG